MFGLISYSTATWYWFMYVSVSPLPLVALTNVRTFIRYGCLLNLRKKIEFFCVDTQKYGKKPEKYMNITSSALNIFRQWKTIESRWGGVLDILETCIQTYKSRDFTTEFSQFKELKLVTCSQISLPLSVLMLWIGCCQ